MIYSKTLMHSTGVAIASLLVAATSVFGVTYSAAWAMVGLSLAVALLGVPHGGLDHLTGRKLLADRLPVRWIFVFFPAYLAVSLIVVVGWFTFPSVTAISFFLISAWHFGLEDDRHPFRSRFVDNVAAIAVGGLVIWVPMLTQGERIASILQAIIPANFNASAATIIAASQMLAYLLVPLAAVVIARQIGTGNWIRAFRNSSFVALFALTDVLISFGIYFCGWHSIRGLMGLAKAHQKSLPQLAVAAAPLSLAAIGLAALGMWAWSSGQGLPQAVERTLFVALSAMAVPHLLLHGPMAQVAMKSGSEGVRSIEATGVTS